MWFDTTGIQGNLSARTSAHKAADNNCIGVRETPERENTMAKRNSVANVNASAKAAAKGRKGNTMKNIDTNALVQAIIANIDIEAIVAQALAGEAAPAKETGPSEAQLEARKAWGERQKAAAERRNIFKSPEYTELWEQWKERKAKAYEVAKTRADKKALNHEGHVWVMKQLDKAAKAAKKSA